MRQLAMREEVAGTARTHAHVQRPAPHRGASGHLDAQRLTWLQAGAGNRAVASLLAVQRCGSVPPEQCGCHDEDGRATAVQRHAGETAGSPQTETPQLPPNTGVFSDRVLRRFSTAVTSGDEDGALRIIVNAMIARGEMDDRLLTTHVVEGRATICATEAAVRVDPGMRWALVTPCGCTPGEDSPNPRLQVHPDLVSAAVIGPGRTAHNDAAARLHAILVHEFRHIQQEADKCAGGTRMSGLCTDCNSPEEMDAYLAEVESAHHEPSVRDAWARVVGNWDYLSAEQRATFSARKDAARQRVDTLFPGVDWDTDRGVVNARAHCERLGARLPGDQHGACSSAA